MSTRFFAKPIVTDGLELLVDPYNDNSFVGGDVTTFDLSLNEYNGTLNNGVSFDTNNWGFDGVNDYIGFGDVLDKGTSDFTLSAWVKLVNNGLAVSMIFSKRESSGGFTGYTLRVSSTGFPTIIYDGAQGAPNRFSSQAIYDDVWHYVVAVFKPSGNVLNIYTDGVLTNGSSAGSPSTAGSVDNAVSFQVGQRNNDFWLEGSVGLVSVYNRALSAVEVLQNYNATKWKFQ